MRRAVLFIAFLLLLSTPALAAELDPEQYEAYGAGEVEEAIPDSASEVLGGAGVDDALDTEGMFSRLWDSALDKLGEHFGSAAASAVKLVAIAALCSLAGTFGTQAAQQYVNLAGCLAVAAVAFTDAGAWIQQGAAAIEDLNTFSRALLPCLTATAAAGGMAGSAAAKYAATSLFMDVLITLSRSLLVPMAYALLAVKTAAAALENAALDSAGKLIKWAAVTVTTLVMTAFTLWLTLSGSISGAADALTAKAAKSAISAALPVVGGIISDAATTLVAGAGLLRSAVGVLGAAVVIAVCITPFLGLALRYLLYKAAAALSSAFAGGRLAGLIADVGTVFGLVLGVTGACAAMLFVSILSFVKAVTP